MIQNLQDLLLHLNIWRTSVANGYKKPYFDSSVFIAWVKGEKIGKIDRGKIAHCILSEAERGNFKIYTSTLTLAEVHKLKSGSVLPNGQSDRIIEYLERSHIVLIDLDRRIGESANRLCRKYGIYPNDAIHFASALKAGCDILFAWDNRFSKVKGEGLSIIEPFIEQEPLFDE